LIIVLLVSLCMATALSASCCSMELGVTDTAIITHLSSNHLSSLYCYHFFPTAKLLFELLPTSNVPGGEEDGVDNSDVDSSRLYTQPEEVWYTYQELTKVLVEPCPFPCFAVCWVLFCARLIAAENVELCLSSLRKLYFCELLTQHTSRTHHSSLTSLHSSLAHHTSLTTPHTPHHTPSLTTQHSTPPQVPNGQFTVAASFGNVHGVYSPGNVDLQPVILHNTQVNTTTMPYVM
jgi:hypothetical protein